MTHWYPLSAVIKEKSKVKPLRTREIIQLILAQTKSIDENWLNIIKANEELGSPNIDTLKENLNVHMKATYNQTEKFQSKSQERQESRKPLKTLK